MGIDDHPLGKTLPTATETASIQTGPNEFRAFAARENAPVAFDDFLDQDMPQLSLHITSFNDATLVGLLWPHTLMDVMGQQALLRSWCLVLAGRESEVPTMLGAREDPISAALDTPLEEEDFKVGEKQLMGFRKLSFGVRFALDLLWNRAVETRTIFLPKKAMAELRCQAHADLAARNGTSDKASFVSEGDVLTAWAVRAVASSLPQPRPVTLLQVLNARFRLSSLSGASGVYIQNMAVAAFTFLSPEVASGPLGFIALENRRHLMEQSTEGQVLAFLRQLRRAPNKSGSDPATVVCSEPNALLMPFTNWTRAEFFNTIDFSPAVVCTGDTTKPRSNAPGTLVYHHASSMQENPAARNVIVVLGKDHSEGYWLTGSLLPPAWAKIQEQINALSQ